MATKQGINYVELAEGIEAFKEVIGAQVSALVADGFSDEQAREIVTGLWRSTGRPTPGDDD